VSTAALARWESEPDTVLYNGAIWTVSEHSPQVEALAISDGRILATGTSAEMRALATRRTRLVDLGQRRVTPGFNDAHCHPILSGVQHLREVALDKNTIESIQAALRARAARTPAGEPVVGFLYDDGKTPRPLNRADLDQVSTDHPVIVRHRGGHTIFVNSAALRKAGIQESTPDPQHGQYFRDSAGKLNGRVADKATESFEKLITYRPTREDFEKGTALIGRMFTSKGVTSACDALGDPQSLRGIQDARAAGDLRIRIYSHIGADYLDQMLTAGVQTGLGDEWVRVGAVKLFCDGSISERTAWLSEPYLEMGDYRGLQTTSPEDLYSTARKAHLAGWQIGIHANGDLAIDRVLGIFERLQKESPRRDPRFRIEHCTLLNADLIRRIRAVGAIPIPFACYVYFHGDVMHFYGADRTRHMFAMREMIDAGLRPPSSSDYTASPSDPVMWLQSQVTRRDYQGHEWGTNQRITIQEAIRAGTLDGAAASFEEHLKGSLEPGKLADLVVWERDLLTLDPGQLVTVKAERTMVGGRWVYES
ncbi:MAG TPA: amidohydrolase, partial [Steroidobacteraceae bacterium]|nr:amidohydrolase [Steroidobacteraceae bacterium]